VVTRAEVGYDHPRPRFSTISAPSDLAEIFDYSRFPLSLTVIAESARVGNRLPRYRGTRSRRPVTT